MSQLGSDPRALFVDEAAQLVQTDRRCAYAVRSDGSRGAAGR